MKKEDKDFLILEIAKSDLIKKDGLIYAGDLRKFINQLEEPEQDIDAAHDLLAKITTLSQEDFDLYWNCINDGVTIRNLKQEKMVAHE